MKAGVSLSKVALLNTASEIMGGYVLALTQSAPEQDLPDLLVMHGFHALNAYTWYPLRAWLELLNDLSARSTLSMETLGRRAAAHMALPHWIDSLSTGLLWFEELYQRSHRGGNHGEVSVRVVHGRYIRFTIRTPYPSAFIKGMLHGLAARLLPANTKLDVREGRSPDRTLTLDVRW